MSRIHEALKKAQMEHSPLVEPSDVRPLMPIPDVVDNKIQIPPHLPSLNQRNHLLDELRGHRAHTQWHFDPPVHAFGDSGNGASCAEHFRVLRSRLYQLRKAQPLRSLIVTSPRSGDGKSFVVTNLAHAIVCQPERSVLVIDADLRRSHLHALLGAAETPGLSEYLRGEADEGVVLQFGTIGQGGILGLISGGKKIDNPTEMLANGRLKVLLDRVGPAFDWVIFDSPPCLGMADASVVADVSDGLLMVVKAGSTPVALVEKARQEVHKRNVLGVVLNAVEDNAYASANHYKSGSGRQSLL